MNPAVSDEALVDAICARMLAPENNGGEFPESTVIAGPTVMPDGTQVTRLRRIDDTEYEVRIPDGTFG